MNGGGDEFAENNVVTLEIREKEKTNGPITLFSTQTIGTIPPMSRL
jgi:hypothetical protein